MAEAQNPSSNMMTDDILLFNILPRLPPKSVGRFRCVSRQWHSFLTTPVFAKMHHHHLIANEDLQNHHKLLLLSTKTPFKFSSIDCETPEDRLSAIRPLPFEAPSGTHMSIVTSLHGLVCVNRRPLIEYPDLILWNPLTGDYKTLSKASSDEDDFQIKFRGRFGLYYASSEDDYKLLCITRHPKVYIYSLKSDSWRKVESTKRTPKCNSSFLKTSIFLDEKVYFLREKLNNRLHPSYFIMCFDTKTEKLRDIETPTFKERTDCMGFMVLKGSIYFSVGFTDYDGGYHRIELWRMNGDGDWTKMVTHSPIERLSRNDEPLHIMKNGDWLIYSDDYVYQRDMNMQTVNIMCPCKSMDINQERKYMETLVSPNEYVK